jgi:peptide/nickel transport system ATP-binding protein
VTTQAEIVKILTRLRDERHLSVLFITHDLALAAEVCDRVCVMYAGRVVEDQAGTGVFEDPRHPYTHALLAARPSLDARSAGGLAVIPGQPASAMTAPPACPFHTRCPFVLDEAGCRTEDPPLLPVDGVPTACWRAEHVRAAFAAEDRA